MKLSRRGKRTKCAKRTKRFKLKRNTKKQFRQYKRKNTYRKHSHKLRKNKRVMRGGEGDVNLRYQKGDSYFTETGDFTLTEKKEKTTQKNVTPKEPQQNSCIGLPQPKEYNFTFTLIRNKDSKNFTIYFIVSYMTDHKSQNEGYYSEYTKRKLVISTKKIDKPTENEEFCTVTKSSAKNKKLKISTGDIGAFSDLKLVSDKDEIYTFPVSSTRNKIFFINLVKNIAQKFDVCESDPDPVQEYRPYDGKNIQYPSQFKGAYFGDQDPLYKKMMYERNRTETSKNSTALTVNDNSVLQPSEPIKILDKEPPPTGTPTQREMVTDVRNFSEQQQQQQQQLQNNSTALTVYDKKQQPSGTRTQIVGVTNQLNERNRDKLRQLPQQLQPIGSG